MFSALPPFAIDTYMPAFSTIANYFGLPEQAIITSVTTYFIGFGIGMLIWGSASDRYGRKPILIIGMALYTFSTIFCSMSQSFNTLMLMRGIQGLGDATGAVIAMSIARDCYSGIKLTRILASIAMVMMVAPIISPIIGSIIISTTKRWQDIFHFLTLYGLILLFISFFLKETLDKPCRTKTIKASLSHYQQHITNYKFITYSFSSGLLFSAFFTFISSASVILIGHFKFSYLMYCFAFALNIVSIFVANLLIKKFINDKNMDLLISFAYTICFLGVVTCFILGSLYDNAWGFMLGIMMVTFGFSLGNAIITSRSLSLLKTGFGAGNAINNFIKFTLGGLASFSISHYSSIHLSYAINAQQFVVICASFLFFLFNKNVLNKANGVKS